MITSNLLLPSYNLVTSGPLLAEQQPVNLRSLEGLGYKAQITVKTKTIRHQQSFQPATDEPSPFLG